MQNSTFDYLVIGGGIVGANIFSLLARSGHNVVMVDKALDVATGASKANSGLVHAGFDAMSGTLKARLNVLGNAMYEKQAKRLGLPIKKTGAFVVGNDKNELEKLYARGLRNGVKDLQILEKDELNARLPMLSSSIKYALFAKNAYIISPYMFTICLTEEGIVNGGKVILGFEPQKIIRKNNVFEVYSADNLVKAKSIINCAGAGYNSIAKLLGSEEYEHEYRRGEYYVLDSTEKDLVPSTIFPLPTKTGKGVLITPTIDGNILVGPTSELSDTSTKTTKEGLAFVSAKSKELVPSINLKKTIRIFAGIRSITGNDFIIEKSQKVPNVINIAGICSPGLSAAPAIASYVFNLLSLEERPLLKAIKIKPYTYVAGLPVKKQNELIAINPRYGKIVCKCEGISEGEIIDALHRPLKVYSIDGIKRRTRTGMGRCQGGFCMSRVIELIAKENNISLFDVVKENKGSSVLVGNVKGQ